MTGSPHDDLAEALRSHRETLNLSVRAAAKLAGFSEGRWRQLESGYELRQGVQIASNPTPMTVARAAYALGVPAEELFRAAGIDADPARFVEQIKTAKSKVGAGGLTTRQLMERMSDLHLDELRRLRDMVDGAIAVQERIAEAG
ncbi:MAG TPA: helix-turn-helix transcriptional regulator [Amycolatopsis sp.]|jgi:transcriptional regulator with XRE-family HTH domain|nr:helix-turn-helix transcriptional regulator [Amycolatopsis sp.]